VAFLFLAAVTISAWYGGLGPGLLATAVAASASLFTSVAVTGHGLRFSARISLLGAAAAAGRVGANGVVAHQLKAWACRCQAALITA
jgi:hypothetical protein